MSRYTFGGDEHLFVEISEEMSLTSFFRSLTSCRAIEAMAVPGVTEICPANASFQVRFDPDVVTGTDLVARIKQAEETAIATPPMLETRILELPVFFGDPWTTETRKRFDDRHQEPGGTDLAYAAKINDKPSVEAFVDAYVGAPWFVSMVGFVAGLPFMYQMVERARQIEVPKYLRPRTDTPRLTVGHGGCFSCIYSVQGAGGYQMLGVTPIPIYDPAQRAPHLTDFMILFRPGDIVRFKPIGREDYDRAVASVDEGTFRLRSREVTFSLKDFENDPVSYNAHLMETLDAD